MLYRVKAVFKSKTRPEFRLHAAAFAAKWYWIRHTHAVSYDRESGLPSITALTVMDYVDRYEMRAFSAGPPLFIIQHDLRCAIRKPSTPNC